MQTDSLQQFITVDKTNACLYFFRYLLVKSKIVQEDDGLIYSKANRERYIEAMCKLIPLFFLGPNEDDPIVLDPKRAFVAF